MPASHTAIERDKDFPSPFPNMTMIGAFQIRALKFASLNSLLTSSNHQQRHRQRRLLSGLSASGGYFDDNNTEDRNTPVKKLRVCDVSVSQLRYPSRLVDPHAARLSGAANSFAEENCC